MTKVTHGIVIFLAVIAASSFCTPRHSVIRTDAGREYQIVKIGGLVVGDGSRVLRVSFLADSIEDHEMVRQAARDLLPHFQSQAGQGEFDAIAFTARHDLIRVATCYRSETFTVVYEKKMEDETWAPI